MLAIKGYIDSGRFTPTDGTQLPTYAHAVLVLEGVNLQTAHISTLAKDKTARKEWLNQLDLARQLAKDEPLPDFIVRPPMREPHGLTD
ncbi:MAG: hypothetical protein LBC96_03335 [Lachnospiraceae bacterium]|jgi:hypothetical protein|nr:hypothetical protein [Lachnospiraceae bacterium]